MSLTRLLLAAGVACATIATSACASDQGAAGAQFKPARPGVLTVATAFLPAPGFWQGDPPTRGFEAGLARALADHLGLERVVVVQVPFAAIVTGQLHGADIALSQLTPTDERERLLDFSTPYLVAPAGVLARRGVVAIDVQELQGLRWVVSRTSTLTPIVESEIRPTSSLIEVQDRTSALRVLRSGSADALLLDLPVALGLAYNRPGVYEVLAQLPGGEGLAAALPDGSPNREIVDSAIRSLQADGTIEKLTSRWLGASAGDVPLIRTEG
jgi:polar amino acid transport system substrate-binding protein